MPNSLDTTNPSNETRAGARSQDCARPGASDTAALREKLAEAVTKILDVMDHIDGDPDYEPEPVEWADDDFESAEPIRDPMLYVLALERKLNEVR